MADVEELMALGVQAYLAEKIVELTAVRTFESFGAAPDGDSNDPIPTDNRVLIQSLLSQGSTWSGGGKTYGVAGSVIPLVPPSGEVGLIDCNFVQLAPTTPGCKTLSYKGYSKLEMRRVRIRRHMDNVDATAIDDTGNAGIQIDSCDTVNLIDCAVEGDGSGTLIRIINCREVNIVRPVSEFAHWHLGADPITERIVGLRHSSCGIVRVYSPRMSCLTGQIALGPPIIYQTDGQDQSACDDVVTFGARYECVTEGTDNTGGTPGYNLRVRLIGGTARSCPGFGFKNVGNASDWAAYFCVAIACGDAGFVMGGRYLTVPPNSTTAQSGQNILGCTSINSGGSEVPVSDGTHTATDTGATRQLGGAGSGLSMTDNIQGHPRGITITDFRANADTEDMAYRPTWEVWPQDYCCYGIHAAGSLILNAQPAVNDFFTFNNPAKGSIIFNANSSPLAGDTVTINTVVITFVAGTPVGNQVQIGATVKASAQNLAVFLQGSANALLTVARYIRSHITINVFHKTAGAAGNSFALAENSLWLTVSGATLTGGSAGTTMTFVAGTPVGNQVQIGATLNDPADTFSTMFNLMNFLSKSLDPNIFAADYTQVGTTVNMTYISWGLNGNDFAIGKSGANLAVSGAKLTGGTPGYSYRAMPAEWTGPGTFYPAGSLVSFRCAYFVANVDHVSSAPPPAGIGFRGDMRALKWRFRVTTPDPTTWQALAPVHTSGTVRDGAGIPWAYNGIDTDCQHMTNWILGGVAVTPGDFSIINPKGRGATEGPFHNVHIGGNVWRPPVTSAPSNGARIIGQTGVSFDSPIPKWETDSRFISNILLPRVVLTLNDGLNSNVVVPTGVQIVVGGGPYTSITIDGFAQPLDSTGAVQEREFILFIPNQGIDVKIVDSARSVSSAVNQIFVGASDLFVTAAMTRKTICKFLYNGSTNRWIMEWGHAC